jgi:predicted RNase H-like nuclease (RuvC/YqgF family)
MVAEFYKGIKDPNELRRYLLECSKDVIRSLQKSGDYESLRKRKEHLILKLKRNIEEINQFYGRLNEILPEEEMEEKKLKKTKIRREYHDIKDLNDELSEIESKMSKLGI